MNIEKYKEYFDTLKRNPSVYIEQLYGIKLFPFQKAIVDEVYKAKQVSYMCNSYYKYQKYMSLCFAYINMKDDAKIVISSPDGEKVMNKEEFCEWLENEYWR